MLHCLGSPKRIKKGGSESRRAEQNQVVNPFIYVPRYFRCTYIWIQVRNKLERLEQTEKGLSSLKLTWWNLLLIRVMFVDVRIVRDGMFLYSSLDHLLSFHQLYLLPEHKPISKVKTQSFLGLWTAGKLACLRHPYCPPALCVHSMAQTYATTKWSCPSLQ
jgi:hypothetical protein